MKKCSLLLACCCIAVHLFAQSRPTVEAAFQARLPEIDGQLTDTCWQNLAPLDAFTTATPVFGEAPKCRTEVRIFYTETALYIAARCFDPDAGGVRYDGGIRDGNLTGDWFQVSLDTWNDDQLSFDFAVSAAGVQQDVRQFSSAWNARWQSAVAREADGWTLEMRIPFGALRYAGNREVHEWGLQLTRYDRSTGQTSTWSPQDPLVADRQLQFGTLTGLRNIRQTGRNLLAVHAGTSYVSAAGNPFFESDYLGQSLGIDGRLGLNESTTLDFTLLPPLTYLFNLNSVIYYGDQDRIFGNASLPPPRQLEAEEQHLFERGTYINYTPVAYGSQMLWRLGALPPNEFVTSPGQSELLNSFKLTTRTKENWRFGVYNAILGPVKSEIVDVISSSFSRRKETLQKVSNYNYLTAEYLLANTGFIQISNASLLSGPGANSAMPALDFRLRDRRNAHQIAGSMQLDYQQLDTAGSLGHHYHFAISRINRRWGWSMTHAGDYIPGSLFFAVPGRHYASSNAGITYQNFKPSRRFLNVFAAAGLSPRWAANPGEQTVWNLNASLGVLNWNFQRYEFGLSTIPYRRTLRYENSGAYLNRKTPPRVDGNLGFTSDQRKRMYWTAQAAAAMTTRGDVEVVRARLGTVWIAGPRFSLQFNTNMSGTFGNLELLNTPGRWVFERNNVWQVNANLEASWYPMRRCRVYAGLGWHQYDYTNREALELQAGTGELAPVMEPLPQAFETYEASGTLGFQYFFKDISQIGFSYLVNPQADSISGIPPVFEYAENRLNLNVIYVIGGSGKR